MNKFIPFALLLSALLGACSTNVPVPPSPESAAPIMRIVSPLGNATVSPGTGVPGTVTALNTGAGFVINLEIVTRDDVKVKVREATVGPGSAGIRHEDLLGQANPDFPDLTVSADVDLIKPDGGVIARGTNLAALFNVAGTDDTPGPGVTVWAGWHVLESLPAGVSALTLTASVKDDAGRVSQDKVTVQVRAGARTAGQELTLAPGPLAGDGLDDPDGPEVSLIAPRVPSSISPGPSGTPPAGTGSLFFIQVSATDRSGAGIGVREGLIFDPTKIANPKTGTLAGPNSFYPGLELSFDVPLIQPNGNRVAAGANLAPLFDVAGSETGPGGAVRTTADWVVGGSLDLPAGKTTVTITARVTDNAGKTTTTRQVVGVSSTVNGQELTSTP
ncbi:hypothetical protein E7T06_16970 [Deinococcus sp. Arct2-2]|uniref:hypothetical protein n=1 Tax=Deinococcus sp. Arct2-2 TaxID=2568653 RepID=UPI0010A3BDD8|nr:hypothetical protein [Deinococcus sp. Arct2-2]THF68351.1 hypothetical protein E7T06_16970 [Deinococcus sp. Arct2-2]